VPVGVTVPATWTTVAVNVTDWLNTEGFTADVTVVVVLVLLTVINGLVLASIEPSETLVAMSVWLPAVLKVMLNVCVPAARPASPGNVAVASLAVMRTVPVAFVVKFQLASTALTVTLNGPPTVRAVGEFVLPVVVPGEANSPGTRSCSFVNDAAVTFRLELAT